MDLTRDGIHHRLEQNLFYNTLSDAIAAWALNKLHID
jgi:hypothetical protein